MGLRVVVEHLCAIGVESLGRERVIDTQLAMQNIEGRADPLKRDAGATDASQRVRLSETDERNRAGRNVVTIARPTTGLRPSGRRL